MIEYHDALDTQDAQLRQQNLYWKLPAFLDSAVHSCNGLANHLTGHDLAAVDNAEALQALPVLRKSDLMRAQAEAPPFGGFVNEQALPGCRVFQSPGPVWEPQVTGIDPWQAARCLHAAGFRHGDRVHNTFSYHQTPGGFILDEGARALGCVVYPAGVGNTDAQVDALRVFAATAFIGTPDYLQTVLQRATELGVALPALKRAMVSGGALFPSMREYFASTGLHVQQSYATADLGVVAYESSTGSDIHPGMLINEHLIVEIVRPGSGEPVDAGDVGEMLVTRLNPDYPLVRFATGDMSKFIEEPSPCGRTQRRIAGWMGRADQRTKVRGMFVDPVQIQNVRQAHPEISQLRLLVSRENDKDTMALMVSATDSAATLAVDCDAIAATLKQQTGLTGTVLASNTALPGDGIVIEDQREYDT